MEDFVHRFLSSSSLPDDCQPQKAEDSPTGALSLDLYWGTTILRPPESTPVNLSNLGSAYMCLQLLQIKQQIQSHGRSRHPKVV